MKFVLTSDTHWGHPEWVESRRKYFWKEFKKGTKGCSAIVHCGDFISCSQDHWEGLAELRKASGKLPILMVLGNHDFWHSASLQDNEKPWNFQKIDKHQKKMFRKYGIHYLPGNPIKIRGVDFVGFDGWYGNLNPPTNDATWMSGITNVHTAMTIRNERQVDQLMGYLENASEIPRVCVSHFGPKVFPHSWESMAASQSIFEMLEGMRRIDLFCVGHTHHKDEAFVGMTKIINPGGDYGSPKFQIVEVGK